MQLTAEWIELPSQGERMRAYLARPAAVADPLPAVLVVQEIWGVDPHIQDVTQRLATAGYAALAPDLFSHGGTPPALAPGRIAAAKAFMDRMTPAEWSDAGRRAAEVAKLPSPEREEVGETLQHLLGPDRPRGRWLADLRAAFTWLRASPAARGRRVGSIGFCMGGGLSALLAAAEPDLGAAVVFYGDSPAQEQVASIQCPVLGIYGEQDARVTSTVAGFAAAMREAGKRFEWHVYPKAPHAFFNDTRPSYRPEAARFAWAETLGFLAGHLTPTL